MENGVAATDEWKRLDQAYNNNIRMLPVLIDTTTDEYYSFKQYKTIDNVNHYIFYNIKYNAETNKILYTEADLNTQEGVTALATKEIPLGNTAVTYQGANGIEINDTAEENTKTIELKYGKTKEQDFEIPVLSYLLDITSSQTEYYISDSNRVNDFNKNSYIRIYTLDSNNQKILIEDNPTIYVGTADAYIGININEIPYDSVNDTYITTYTTKNETYGISGIFLVDAYDFTSFRFYSIDGQTQEKSRIPLIITRKAQEMITIPEEMLKYGKNSDKLLDLTRPLAELMQEIPEVEGQYLPRISYSEKNGLIYSEFNSFYAVHGQHLSWEDNSTFSTNFLYGQESISYIDGERDEDQIISVQLEVGDDTVNNFVLNYLNQDAQYLYTNPSELDAVYLLPQPEEILSLRYLRYNISTSLSDIIATKTWTVETADKANYTALLVLVTLKSGVQYWVPLFHSADDRVDIFIVGIKRPFVIKNQIPMNFLPTYGEGYKTPSRADLKDNDTIILTGGQTRDYIDNELGNHHPTVEVAYSITNEGEDASKPVANSTLYSEFVGIQNSLAEKASLSDINNAIANAQIDYQTQIINTPTIPTAASIQSEMTYDTEPTENSNNLIKSKDLYTIQQNLVEQINGKAKGYVFDTNADLQAWLTDENKAKLKIGDVLYIKEAGYPDYWWDGTSTQYLETQKVDLTDYYTKSEISASYADKDSLNNYQSISDRDIDITIEKATITVANNGISYNTKNSCVEITLQTENIGIIRDLDDASKNKLSLTILKVYEESNLNKERYIFTFNHGHQLYSGYLNFLPDNAPEGTYYGSDILTNINTLRTDSYQQYFLQAWIQQTSSGTPKTYLKRTDFSTQQFETVTALPDNPEANTIYFVTES